MNANTIFLSTALAAALAAATAAHAADAKVYPGNACQAVYGSQAGDLFHFQDALLNTTSTTYRSVTCPIVRDRTGNTSGVIGADVRVKGNPQVWELECFLYSFSSLGELVASDFVTTTSQNVNVLPLDIDISANGGTYSLLCDLPPGGLIYGYSVNEY